MFSRFAGGLAAFLVGGFAAPHAALAEDVRPPFVVEDPPQSPASQQSMFHLPEGFQIDLVASEPEIINPINLNFDAAGRLYVSQSIEYPIPAPPDRPGRDRILRIVDTDDDGVPDRVSTFADELNIPIGVTPVPGGVLGFSVPRVYFFPDADGDGGADPREVRFEEFGFDDTHGMVSSLTWWIDGWIYGCHGFVNTSKVAGADGQEITMTSGNTYRLRADGSRIEHWAHGQVNPFGLTFDPWGNVFTADCHTRPATMLLRGAHYPRSPGDGLGLGPELMQHAHGSTGIAGIVYYAADRFPKKYQGSLFIGNPITGRINHDLLDRHGSTYTAIEQPDFLTCDDPWFRPVDLQLGPDGALYIADMYNCIIGHYEVPLLHPQRDREHGRIWRVSYVGPDGSAPDVVHTSRSNDLTKASLDELLQAIAGPNLTVRTLATHQLVERIGAAAVGPVRAVLSGESAETQRAHGLWILQRLGALTRGDWEPRIADSSALVRLHAVKVLAETDDWDAAVRAAVIERLADEDAFVCRAAVEAVGRHPHESSVRPVMRLIAGADPADACLVHSSRIALRDTLTAVDALPQLEQALSDSTAELTILADVAVGIPTTSAAEFLWRRFQADEVSEARRSDVLRHVIRHIDERKLNEVLTLAESYFDRDVSTQIAVVSAVHAGAQERGLPIPPVIREWGERLVTPLLASDQVIHVKQGLTLAEQMRLTGAGSRLAQLAAIDTPFPSERIAAVQALLAVGPPELVPAFLTMMHDEKDIPALRQFVAEKLANRKDAALRSEIAAKLPAAPQLVTIGLARGLVIDPDGAAALLTLIEQGKVSRQVLQDRRVQRLLPISGLADGAARMKSLIAGLPSIDESLQQMIDQRRIVFRSAQPNVAHGAEVFRKTCAVCHRLENQGEKVGPELDGIGQRGVDRLLEDVLDPNRTVDKSFRATVVLTENGQVFTGLALGEEGRVLILADQLGKQQRIPLAEIEERRLIEGSAMPANVDELLKPDDFNDLLAFLLTKTAKPPPGGGSSP
ncbi:MAG: PVC-type heme-binding CxxCH protein [Planctomycetaceae bacterium]